ncbi:MAG: hypothetical protein HS108_01830 [Planctomycetes bacterium]|jgi:hypothetical protein|nr:hypothetical protein [Planctomycetota bacterium]MCL4731950.1 hypothetical protein [Planctomycetota bacterium]
MNQPEKRELAPLKSSVKFDPEAEIARLDAELAGVERRARRLSRLALWTALAGLALAGLVTLFFRLVYGWLVFWGLPAAVLGVIVSAYLLLQGGRLRAHADFLARQKRETKSLQKRAQIRAGG